MALLTTCRNGRDPNRTVTRATPESTNGNGRTTASENSPATEKKAILSTYEYNELDTVFIEGFLSPVEPEEDTICLVTHRMPSFPGGYDSLRAFIRRNTRYPSKAKQENIRGMTFIRFVVDKKGNIVRPEVMSSLSPECDREALRVVRSMPKWEPGMINRSKPYINLTEPDTAAKELPIATMVSWFISRLRITDREPNRPRARAFSQDNRSYIAATLKQYIQIRAI